MEIARFTVDVQVAEDVLHEVYLPHFRQIVEAGADAVMSSYNSVNGEWAGQNRHLLTDILRDQWGFEGFVMTDFVWGLRAPVESVAAGQDLEMPFRQQRGVTLPKALRGGRLQRSDALRAAHRLLTAQVQLTLRARPTPPRSVVACPAHRAPAHEAAVQGAVLLRNVAVDGRPVLPLADTGRIAVIGALAHADNQGDVASSAVHPPAAVSLLDGLRERLGDRVIHVATDDRAGSVAAADAVVSVVGLTAHDEGESITADNDQTMALLGGAMRWRPARKLAAAVFRRATAGRPAGGDRVDLHLPAHDVRLTSDVAAANPRTVVVVIGGGTVMPDPWDQQVAGLLVAWYPGMEGGRAMADILLGDAEPGGRLPFAIPQRREDLPMLDWRTASARYDGDWGQRRLDRAGVPAAYPLSFGLGYTTMGMDGLTVAAVGHGFTASVTMTNTGMRPGRHVVQLYAAQTGNPVADTGVLVGFRTVELKPGRHPWSPLCAPCARCSDGTAGA